LNMGAIRKFTENDIEKAALYAIWTNDIILISHAKTFLPMKTALILKAKKDIRLRKRIEKAFDKVLRYKKKIGLIS
ncbi:MAG: hypothetical protein R6U94_13635, partial [Nitriliruptoraceae bacterium]